MYLTQVSLHCFGHTSVGNLPTMSLYESEGTACLIHLQKEEEVLNDQRLLETESYIDPIVTEPNGTVMLQHSHAVHFC